MLRTITLTLTVMFLSAVANADVIKDISTESALGWTVKRLAGSSLSDGGQQYDAVHWYNDKQGYSDITPGAWANTSDWITVPSGFFQTGTGNNSYNGAGANGYYAFTYSFDLADLTDANYFSLALKVMVDDSLLGVYLNGNLLNGNLENFFNKKGDILQGYIPLIIDNPDNLLNLVVDDLNELSFVVLNNGENTNSNPVGISLEGQYAVTYNKPVIEEGEISTATPEPATMLIFGLGVGGAALARVIRRRK